MNKQITAIGKKAILIWNEVAEDKWMETLVQRSEEENGDSDWFISSETKYIDEEDVESFITKLAKVGFTIHRGFAN